MVSTGTGQACATGGFSDQLASCIPQNSEYWVCTVLYRQTVTVTGVGNCAEITNSETGNSGTCVNFGSAGAPQKADNRAYRVYRGGLTVQVDLTLTINELGFLPSSVMWSHYVYLPGPPASAQGAPLPQNCGVCTIEYVGSYLPNTGELMTYGVGTVFSQVPW